MTRRTRLRLSTAFSASAFTFVADHILSHFELLRHATGDILQRQFHFQSQVGATVYALATATSSAKTAEATESTLVTTEDVTEHGEDVVHIHVTAEAAEATSSWCIESELVILPTLVRVVQYLVGFCCLLEFLLGCLVTGITVRVVFDGELAVCHFYLVFGGVAVHAQHLVIVSFLCHNACPTAFIVLLQLSRGG